MSKTTLLILYIAGGLFQVGAAITGTLSFRDNLDGSAELNYLKWATLALAAGTLATTIAGAYSVS